VHTPHILKLSGVGPADELNKFSIPVVKDIPGVGGGLTDHPVVRATFKTRQKRDFNDLNQFGFARIKSLVQYTLFKAGPLTSNVRSHPLSTAFN
jgi:choline dehydrogenase